MKQLVILFIFLFFLIFTVNEVYAEELSLKSQIQMGLNSDEIICRDNMVLTLRSNDNLACVYESTSEKLQWNIIQYRTLNELSPYSNESFSIPYKITSGAINGTAIIDNASIFNVNIIAWDEYGKLEIVLPFGFITNELDEDVFVVINQVEVEPAKLLHDSGDITLIIQFEKNDTSIEIIVSDPT